MALKFLNNGYFAGKVGIGTVHSANYTLNVSGAANFSNDIQIGRNATALSFDMNPSYGSGNYYLSLHKNQAEDGGIILRSKPTSGSAQSDWQIVNQGTTGDLKFFAYGLADYALILDRETGNATFAGDVNMASAKIESDGSAAAGAYLELHHNNNNSTDVCATINLTNNAGGYASIIGGTTGANNTGYIEFKTDNAGTQGTVLTLNGDNSATFAGDVNAGTGLRMYTDSSGNGVIYNLGQDKDLYFVGDDGGTGINALVFDMSEGGAATFAGALTIPDYIYHTGDPNTKFGFGGNDSFQVNTSGTAAFSIDTAGDATFAGDVNIDEQSLYLYNASSNYWRVQNNSSGKLVFKQGTTQRGVWSSGELELTNNLIVGGGGTFAGAVDVNGNLAVEDEIHLTDGGSTVRAKLLLNASDRDNVELRAESLGSTMKFFTVGTEALGLDAQQYATFAGKINAKGGASITGSTAATINAYTTTVSSNLYSALRIIDNTAASTYWDIGAVGGTSPDLKFFVNASTAPRFTLSTAGNATFAGDVTATANYSAGNSKIIYKAQRSGGAVAGDWSYDDATTDMSLGTSTAHSFSLKTGNTRALTLNSSQNATFAGDVTIGSSGASSDKTLNILTGGSKSAVKLMEAGTVYGFSTIYDGAANKFHINRHNNSAAGTPVLSLNRDDNNATFAGDVNIGTGRSIYFSSTTGLRLLHDGSNGNIINSTGDLKITNEATDRDIIFRIKDGASSLEAMRVDGSSNQVGIGTTSPGDKLEIGNLTNYTGLTVKGAGASRPAVTFKNATQSLLGAIYGTEGRDIIIETGGNGTTGTVALTLSSAGALKLNTYTAGTLVSDASGNITVSSGGGAGGPYLPLSAGSTKKLTDTLYIQGTNTTNQESVLLRGVASGDGDFLGSIRTANTGGYNQEMRFYTSNANGTTDEDLNLTLKPDQSAAFAGSVLVNGTNVTVANASNPYVYLNDTNAGAAIFQQEGNTTRIGSDSNTQVVLVQNNATAVTIGTNKNVGIGDTLPTSISANTFSLSVNSSRTDLSGALVSKANGTVKHQQYWDSTGYGFNLSANSGNFKFTGGNVGIGTAAPGAKLQIGSATYAPNANLSNNLLQIKSPSGFAYLTIGNGDSANATSYIGGASGFIVLGSVTDAGAKSEHIRMTNTGNVGIGTTSPEAKLTIKGDALNTNQPVRITNSVTDTHTGLFLNNTGSTVGEKYGMQFGGYNQYSIGGIFGVLDSASGSTSGDITFDMCNGTSAGSLIERMRITHEGKVGIGTTSPGSLLHLSSSTGPRITLTDTDASIGVDSIIADISFVGTEIGGETARIGAVSETSGGEAGLRFYTGQSVLERLRIDKDGNVGIGTTSPDYKFEVQGVISSADAGLQKATFANVGNDLVLTANADATNATAKILFNSSGSGGSAVSTKMIIDGSGNVGIGTTSPESKLQVAGGIQMANDTATASAAKVGTMRYRTGTEYVEVTGAEILTNPGFDTDTTWVKGTGWTIANGKASVDNASSTALSQPSFGVTTGKIYNVRIDVSNYTSGSLQLQFGASQVIASISANGEYNYTVTSTITGGTFYLYGVGDCEFSVDNASVIEVEAEDASYADMCMQTGSSTYEWVNIVRNTY